MVAVTDEGRERYRKAHRVAQDALASAMSAVLRMERAERALAPRAEGARVLVEVIGCDPLGLIARTSITATPRRTPSGQIDLPSANRRAPGGAERHLLRVLSDGEWHDAALIARGDYRADELEAIARRSSQIEVRTRRGGVVLWRRRDVVREQPSAQERLLRALRPLLPADATTLAHASGVEEAQMRALLQALQAAGRIRSLGRRRVAGRLVTVYDLVED